jgi:hypothetical protein
MSDAQNQIFVERARVNERWQLEYKSTFLANGHELVLREMRDFRFVDPNFPAVWREKSHEVFEGNAFACTRPAEHKKNLASLN